MSGIYDKPGTPLPATYGPPSTPDEGLSRLDPILAPLATRGGGEVLEVP